MAVPEIQIQSSPPTDWLMLTTQLGAWSAPGGLVVERQGVCGGCKEDYEGPATRGLLLEPEKVCRKSGPQNSHLSDK